MFSKVERFSRKLRRIKKIVKGWRLNVKKNSIDDLEQINQRISTIDLLAANNIFDNSMAFERMKLMSKVRNPITVRISNLKQQAKSKWLLDDDENLIFFHGIVNQRFKFSRIHGLNVNKCWVSCPDNINEVVLDFFKSKFEEKHPIRLLLKSSMFRKITETQRCGWKLLSYARG